MQVTSRSRDILHRPTNLKFPPRFLLRPTNLHLHLPPRNTMDTSLLPVSTVSRLLAMPLVVRPPVRDFVILFLDRMCYFDSTHYSSLIHYCQLNIC